MYVDSGAWLDVYAMLAGKYSIVTPHIGTQLIKILKTKLIFLQ